MTLVGYAVLLGFGAVGAAMALNLYRIVVGPDPIDRVLALDTLSYNAVALLMLVGLWFGDRVYFGSALVVAMLGFVSTVALGKYLTRGDIME